MSNLERELQGFAATLADQTKPLEERKAAHKALMDKMLNPKETFDPETFDPLDDVEHYEVKRRERVKPPDRLPTMGMLPKKLLEGQMIGAFESKQDLYLIMAHFINDLLDRVETLEAQVRKDKI